MWDRIESKVPIENIKINKNKLSIVNFTKEDLGLFICKFYCLANESELVYSSQINLTSFNFLMATKQNQNNRVVEKPKIKLFAYNRENLVYDSRIRVDCQILNDQNIGSYSIEWVRKSGNYNRMPTRSYVFANSLIINRFEYDDLGEYVCIVSNAAGQALRSIIFFEDEYGMVNSLYDDRNLLPTNNYNTFDKHKFAIITFIIIYIFFSYNTLFVILFN